MSERKHGRGRLMTGVAAASVLWAGWGGWGCEAPLFDDSPDVARVDRSRLKGIDRRSLAEYLRPAPPAGEGAGEGAGSMEARIAASRARFEGAERSEVSLEECRLWALSNNLDIRVALVDPAVAGERVGEEAARFESLFTLNARWSDLNQPTSSTLASAQSQNLRVEPGVRVPLRTGGTASITLPWNQNENNNAFATLNPSYASDFEFSVSQPLLRGAGRRANLAALRIARYEEDAAWARTKVEVMRQLATVDRAYWGLYRAQRELEVAQQQFELATAQLESARRRERAGAVSEVEVIRAEAGAASRLEAIILAQNDVRTRQRELKRIVNRPGLALESPTVLVAATPPDPVEYGFDPGALVAVSLANRMELLELELKLAGDAASVALEKNQALPLFTLDYVYRVNGLGSSSQDAAKMARDGDFQDWEIGLNAEVPLGNERARSRVRQAILTRLARLSTKEARELSIRQEVLSAVDQMDAGWERIMAARQSVVLSTRAFQAEQRQFDLQRSTSTDVLDAAARLAEAQVAEVRAVVDYQIAQVDLAFATGTLLGQGKIEFEAVARPSHRGEAPAEEVRWGDGAGR
ncbi:MAG: TolC family protein [Phycisphaeraceae bacterium]|nr:MAG: TolC family protein [Phycisphaeraceae bacterium]